MSPDEMSERLAAWTRVLWGDGRWVRRVVCVEPDGPRRTWVLTQGGRQVGHVRMRSRWCRCRNPLCFDVVEWTVEASDRTRAMLGLEAT